MALITSSPKGTADILPGESQKWAALEAALRNICERYGFEEIRTPVFEHTEVFARGVGDTTDVVTKEMYTFTDKGGRSVTLRPEGTAGVVRSFLENGLFNEGLPASLFYLIGCYRYERPQKGRLREFHQFGVEMFGATDPSADATVISLADRIFRETGVKGIELRLNSIGCKDCRGVYRDKLKAFFEDKKDKLCPTCRTRLETNPMRILDCKDPGCQALCGDAPVILDSICDDCREHFEGVRGHLDALGIKYTVDPRIVRGLDYYCRTVFEFVSSDIGAQGTVCGGGRYDGMTEQLGGGDYPGLGLAMGLERFLLLLEAQGISPGERKGPDLFIASMGEAARREALKLAERLRDGGASVTVDLMAKSLKAQMKYAGKTGARYVIVLGDGELESGAAKLKKMADGSERDVTIETLAAGEVTK